MKNRIYLGISLFCLLLSTSGKAEVWSKDDGKVIYFTNIPPKGKQGWKSVWKGGALRGGTCKDIVPAQDNSKERLHRYDAYLEQASQAYGLPKAFLKAVIRVESNFDPHVVSCKQAKGLMQIMPDEQVTHQIRDIFDPQLNILGGARILRMRANQYKGDMALTLASYYAGPGAVMKFKGVPPYAVEYVNKVTKHYLEFLQEEG